MNGFCNNVFIGILERYILYTYIYVAGNGFYFLAVFYLPLRSQTMKIHFQLKRSFDAIHNKNNSTYSYAFLQITLISVCRCIFTQLFESFESAAEDLKAERLIVHLAESSARIFDIQGRKLLTLVYTAGYLVSLQPSDDSIPTRTSSLASGAPISACNHISDKHHVAASTNKTPNIPSPLFSKHYRPTRDSIYTAASPREK